MNTFLAANIIAAGFVAYPSTGDRGIATPPAAAREHRIEMTHDKGLIVEMVVRCARGVSIISYSKVDRMYCSPRLECRRDLAAVIARSCG